jgi:hypothetical protein
MEDELVSKLDSEERKGLKVSVKVFISSLKKEALIEALNSGKRMFHCTANTVW